MTQSHLWELGAGEIDHTVGFRTASTGGLTNGQQRLRTHLLQDIDQVDNMGLYGVGPNHWVGESKPSFSFVSLAPHSIPKTFGSDGVMYDATEISRQQHTSLGRRNFAAIRDVERKSGCKILLSRWEFPQELREIGYEGTDKIIRRAMNAISAKSAKTKSADNTLLGITIL